jgi:23S rRNA (uridine2552-2'-O)-methyltransferase
MSVNKRWLQEHRKDIYFKKAKQEGYPSRAAYKLLEIHEKDKLFKPGMSVVDLGAAPGGWVAVAKELIGDAGVLIAVDLLPIVPVAGVICIQGDFNDEEVLQRLLATVQAHTPKGMVDLVISDMAPNITGMSSIDQPRSLHLVELAWDCAQKILKPKGNFLAKIFQGEGTDAFLADLRRHFKHVKLRKPSASRPKSRELYVLGNEFLGYNHNLKAH